MCRNVSSPISAASPSIQDRSTRQPPPPLPRRAGTAPATEAGTGTATGDTTSSPLSVAPHARPRAIITPRLPATTAPAHAPPASQALAPDTRRIPNGTTASSFRNPCPVGYPRSPPRWPCGPPHPPTKTPLSPVVVTPTPHGLLTACTCGCMPPTKTALSPLVPFSPVRVRVRARYAGVRMETGALPLWLRLCQVRTGPHPGTSSASARVLPAIRELVARQPACPLPSGFSRRPACPLPTQRVSLARAGGPRATVRYTPDGLLVASPQQTRTCRQPKLRRLCTRRADPTPPAPNPSPDPSRPSPTSPPPRHQSPDRPQHPCPQGAPEECAGLPFYHPASLAPSIESTIPEGYLVPGQARSGRYPGCRAPCTGL